MDLLAVHASFSKAVKNLLLAETQESKAKSIVQCAIDIALQKNFFGTPRNAEIHEFNAGEGRGRFVVNSFLEIPKVLHSETFIKLRSAAMWAARGFAQKAAARVKMAPVPIPKSFSY